MRKVKPRISVTKEKNGDIKYEIKGGWTADEITIALTTCIFECAAKAAEQEGVPVAAVYEEVIGQIAGICEKTVFKHAEDNAASRGAEQKEEAVEDAGE